MDIVDSQIHMGPGGIAEVVAAMDGIGISSVVVDEWWKGTIDDPFYTVGEGAFRRSSPTAEIASWTHPGRFSYIIRLDPRDPELRSIVRQARDATHARALRVSPGMNRKELSDFSSGTYDELFGLASENGLPIFVMIAGNTDLLAPVLKRYPDLRLIICHCGMPPGPLMAAAIAGREGLPDSEAYWTRIAAEPLDSAFDKVLRIADHPNVALKWAHAPNIFNCPGFPNEGLRPWLRKALDAFGAERVMWGSDITVNLTGESWAELIFAIRCDPGLSEREREYLLGRTAREWLDWPA